MMSSECTCYIAPTQDILQLHGLLKQHVTIYSPPYSIYDILSPHLASNGRQVKIVITHKSRDVQIVEQSITHHVLQTTIRAFQTHRLAPSHRSPHLYTLDLAQASPGEETPPFGSVTPFSIHGRFAKYFNFAHASPGEETQRECPICFDKICENDGSALPCMHSFHTRCIRPWVLENNSCPVCRHPMI